MFVAMATLLIRMFASSCFRDGDDDDYLFAGPCPALFIHSDGDCCHHLSFLLLFPVSGSGDKNLRLRSCVYRSDTDIVGRRRRPKQNKKETVLHLLSSPRHPGGSFRMA